MIIKLSFISLCYQKKIRLKNKKDFEKVFQAGRGVKEDFLFLKTARNNLKESRFGFIVSQRIANKAILRNKIKRRLRMLAKMNLPRLKKGVDVILIANPGLETKDFWEIEEIFHKIFQKANLFLS